MVYNLVEADEVVARLDNDFNIKQGDYISRIPQWIYQCLSDLNIYFGLVPKAYVGVVANYNCELPSDVKQLIGVEHNGARLERRASGQYKSTVTTDLSYAYVSTGVGVTIHGANVEIDESLTHVTIDANKIRVYDSSTINELPISSAYYYMIPNNKIETSFEDGGITFHYYSLPASYNERLNSLCPLIPDNEAVKDAIGWYLFQSILQRGGKHPVFTLGNPNWKLDPYERYRKARLNAKNKAGNDDPDNARIIDRMWQSVLYNNIAGER